MSAVLLIFSIVLGLKGLEVLLDVAVWSLPKGGAQTARRLIEEALLDEREVDVLAIERETGRRQPVWNAAKSRRLLRPFALLYRTPLLQVPVALILLFDSNLSSLVVWISIFVMWGSAWAATLSALFQRLSLGWLDRYRSDLRPDPSQDLVYVDETSFDAGLAFRRVSAAIAALLFMSIVAYGAVYAGLETLERSSIVCNTPCTSWFDPLYFSTVTTSTVGFGDIAPGSEPARFFVASQALVGPLFLSLWLFSIGANASPPRAVERALAQRGGAGKGRHSR